jgi:propionate CoA-transferase
MDPQSWKVEPMSFCREMTAQAPGVRSCFDAIQGFFLVDLSGCTIRSSTDVAQLRAYLLDRLVPLGRKVTAIVNYGEFTVMPVVLDAYLDMAQEIAQAHSSSLSRYTTGAFMRAKLGRAFHRRGVVPHLFGNERDAQCYLRSTRRSAVI